MEDPLRRFNGTDAVQTSDVGIQFLHIEDQLCTHFAERNEPAGNQIVEGLCRDAQVLRRATGINVPRDDQSWCSRLHFFSGSRESRNSLRDTSKDSCTPAAQMSVPKMRTASLGHRP